MLTCTCRKNEYISQYVQVLTCLPETFYNNNRNELWNKRRYGLILYRSQTLMSMETGWKYITPMERGKVGSKFSIRAVTANAMKSRQQLLATYYHMATRPYHISQCMGYDRLVDIFACLMKLQSPSPLYNSITIWGCIYGLILKVNPTAHSLKVINIAIELTFIMN